MCREETDLHVVMFPWLAFGHISPFAQLSNKLSSHGVMISFFTTSANVDRVKTMLNPSPTTTRIIPLSLPTVDGLPDGVESTAEASVNGAELLKDALDLLQPQVTSLLSQLKPHFVLFDFAQYWLPPLASQLGIKTVYYSVFSPLSTAFGISIADKLLAAHPTGKTIPTIQEIKSALPEDHVFFHLIASLKTFEARDMLYLYKRFNGSPLRVVDRWFKSLNRCTMILLKSCRKMDAASIDYITAKLNKKVLLAGPLVPQQSNNTELDGNWASWLDQFPSRSTIYCSFGSETFLRDDQINSLALGLELTGLPFLLVLNFPVNLDSSKELHRALPRGFLERVEGRGMVHSGWVQQRHILAHESVGCYVFHSGLSSIIEGVVNDCQLVLLPLKGDQFRNAKQVGAEWKAGVEVIRKDEDGHFGKDDIRDAVMMVMSEVEREPARSIRANHKKLKEFLCNNEIQNKFVVDLVEEMKVLSKVK